MTTEAARAWRRVDRAAIVQTWRPQIPRIMTAVMGAQLAAGQGADAYIGEALDAQGLDYEADGVTNPAGLVGVASDGRPLDTLLEQPAIAAVAALAEGASETEAMTQGLASLLMIAATQIEDAFRVAASVAGAARHVPMYTRALTPPSCSRCVVLLGEVTSWQKAFKRHPKCDCISVPTNSAIGDSLRTHPRDYFDSLSRAEQNRIFTRAGAEAIRDGADIGSVVNARRRAAGMGTSVDGTRGALRRVELTNGLFLPVTYTGRKSKRRVKLMPEAIYEIARDREHAIQLLKANGFIHEDWRASLARLREQRSTPALV